MSNLKSYTVRVVAKSLIQIALIWSITRLAIAEKYAVMTTMCVLLLISLFVPEELEVNDG